MNNLKNIALEYKTKYNFNIIPVSDKVAGNWKEWQQTETTPEIIQTWQWQRHNGIAALSGFNNLRCLDFDKASGTAIITETLRILGLPQHYEWVVKSGSGNGYHIWFFADPGETFFRLLGGKKAFYTLNPIKEGECDHIEYRHSNCYTLLPFSAHPSGGSYSFLNLREGEMPLRPPAEVREGILIRLLNLIFKPEQPPPDSAAETEPHSTPGKKRGTKKLSQKEENTLAEIATFLKGKINNYSDYMRIGLSLAPFGDKGKKVFLDICKNNPRYPRDTEAKLKKDFNSFAQSFNGQISLGTLFFIAHRYGWNHKQQKIVFNHITLAAEYLISFYEFRRDTLSERTWFKKRNDDTFTELSETEYDKILFRLRGKEDIKIQNQDLKIIINSVSKIIDPLYDYFTTLPEWDGTDYLSQLAETVTVEEGKEELWKKYLTTWLLGSVSCALNPASVNQTVLILQGTQGIGKTSWISRLVPKSLKDYYYLGELDPENKDSRLIIYRNFIVNLDEMIAYKGKKLFALKSLITESYTKIRPPYGRIEMTYIKRSSFAGSLNPLEFLDDSTGTRRFLVVHAVKTDFRHNIDMDKVFAQLYHLYKKGEKSYFNYEESLQITENNQLFETTTAEEEKLIKHFKPAEATDMNAKYLSTTEISEILFSDTPNHALRQSTISNISRALGKHNFVRESKRINGTPRKVWKVAEIPKEVNYVI